VRVIEIERVVTKQYSLRRELLLHQRVLPSCRRQYELGVFGQLRRVGLFHEYRQIREQQRRENQIRLGRLECGNMAGEVHRTDLRPLRGDDLVLDVEATEDRDEPRHGVATDGRVRVN